MKKITKLEALKLCRRLWTWIAETNTNHNDAELKKGAWPEWGVINEKYKDILVGRVKKFIYFCPCCQYSYRYSSVENLNCKLCPLQNLWGSSDRACCEESSPFKKWFNSYKRYGSDEECVTSCGLNVLEKRKQWAMEIVNACDLEIENIRKRKRKEK